MSTTTSSSKRYTLPRYLFQSAIFPATRRCASPAGKKIVRFFNHTDFLILSDGLTQIDLATSMAIKKLSHLKDPLAPIRFTLPQLIGAMERKDGGKTREYILAALRRANYYIAYRAESGDEFEGFILDEFIQHSEFSYEIRFNPAYIHTVYQTPEVCSTNIDILLNLMPGLKSWLFGFMSAMPEKEKVPLDILHQLTGNNYHKTLDFKKAIKRALSSLYQLGLIGWCHGITRDGFMFWEINEACNLQRLNDTLVKSRCYQKPVSAISLANKDTA